MSQVAGVDPGHALSLFKAGDMGVSEEDGINLVTCKLRVQILGVVMMVASLRMGEEELYPLYLYYLPVGDAIVTVLGAVYSRHADYLEAGLR
jgi:hypothetical protein